MEMFLGFKQKCRKPRRWWSGDLWQSNDDHGEDFRHVRRRARFRRHPDQHEQRFLSCLLRLLPGLRADDGGDPDEPAQRPRCRWRWRDCPGCQGGQHQVKVFALFCNVGVLDDFVVTFLPFSFFFVILLFCFLMLLLLLLLFFLLMVLLLTLFLLLLLSLFVFFVAIAVLLDALQVCYYYCCCCFAGWAPSLTWKIGTHGREWRAGERDKKEKQRKEVQQKQKDVKMTQ